MGILVGLSITLFELFPEESVWSIPVRQADEHMIAVPASGGLTLLLGQKQEAHKTLTKEQQRFWKRILIVDDNVDITTSISFLRTIFRAAETTSKAIIILHIIVRTC